MGKRSVVRIASVVSAALAMICGISIQAAAAPAAPVSYIRPQSLSPGGPPAGAAALGAVPGTSQIDFDVLLAPSHQGELQSLYHDLYDRSSPLYHQWLRPGQYMQMFGPSSSEVAAVESWLRSKGLTDLTHSGLSVKASGSASQVSSALGTPFERYRTRNGHQGYLAQRTPLVPQTLAGGPITGIVGLNSLSMPQPESAPATPNQSSSRSAGTPTSNADGLTPCGAATTFASTNGWYTFDAEGSAYGMNSLLANSQNGHGETIGVYELANHTPSDTSAYMSCFGLTNPVTTVNVDGGGITGTGGTFEANIDIEQVATQAPHASIIAYEGSSSGTGPYDLWNTIVGDDAAQVVSTSWGACESAYVSGGVFEGFSTLFQTAAMQGQTVLAASGESGSEDCYHSLGSTSGYQVDYPASDPNVTGVGGTELHGPGNETTWNYCQSDETISCAIANGGQAAGGGGLSSYMAPPTNQPSVYTWNAPTPPCGTICREVPDISANSGVGMVVYTSGSWSGAIGTSLAAPFVAGLVADRNDGCTTTSGQWNSGLYGLAAQGAYGTGLTDITTGNNDMTGGNGGLFVAGTGYDPASGLGSPLAGGLSCPDVMSVGGGPSGSQVTVTGLGLEHASFSFGGTAATVVSATATQATVTVPAGSGTVTVSATSDLGAGSATSPFTFVPQVTTASLPTGTVGVPYSASLTATAGASPYTWSITSASPPAWLSLNSSTGALSGTPTTSGSQGVTFRVTDADSISSSVTLALTVFADPGVYVPLTPARICDTRVGNPSHLTGPAAQCSNGTAGKTLATGGTQTFNVAGDFSVPASNVTAVVLSVATANAKGPGYFTLFPAGQSRPTAANLNYATGQVVPNLVEVGVGAGGAVSLYTSASSDAIVDLEGYVTTTTQSGAGLYNALSTPARICDTRGSNPSGLTAPDTQCNTNLAHGSPDNLIGPNNPLTVNVEGVGGVPATGVAAVVLNVAVVKPAASGYVTVYPTGDPRPNASNVNYTAGTAVGNRVIVPVSPSGQVTLYATASTDIIVDVSGWFTATGGTTGAEFTPEVDPVRICDTRGSNPSGLTPPNTQCNANVAHASPDHPLVAGTSDLIQATGLASVPTGATAAVLNLADVDPTAGSNLTVYPSGIPPTTSDLNPPTGGVASNLVVATLSGSGSFEVANRGSGHTDIIIDVAGWYTTPV